jgi:recombination protein RecA
MMRAGDLARNSSHSSAHPWGVLSLAGMLVEVVYTPSPAVMSTAAALVREAQEQHFPCAWVTTEDHAFFPLDMMSRGIDLNQLLMVRVPDTTAVAWSAEQLARSGGFGLLVVDFSAGSSSVGQSRFAARITPLARRYGTVVVCLTRGETLGSLVSVRVETWRARIAESTFENSVRAVKDRRYGPGVMHGETVRGPDGVR